MRCITSKHNCSSISHQYSKYSCLRSQWAQQYSIDYTVFFNIMFIHLTTWHDCFPHLLWIIDSTHVNAIWQWYVNNNHFCRCVCFRFRHTYVKNIFHCRSTLHCANFHINSVGLNRWNQTRDHWIDADVCGYVHCSVSGQLSLLDYRFVLARIYFLYPRWQTHRSCAWAWHFVRMWVLRMLLVIE